MRPDGAAARRLWPALLLVMGGFAAVWGLKLRLIGASGSPVPTVDQWYAEARALLLPALDGQFKLKYLFVPHNEHRVVLTRLLNLGLALANHQWDPLLEMTVNAAIAAGVAASLVALAWARVRGPALVLALGTVVALFGSPCAWENTLGGFQSQFYLMQLAAVAQVWLMVPARPLRGRWWAGFACGVLALGTMASGFLATFAVIGVRIAASLASGRRRRPDFRELGLLVSLGLVGVLLLHPVPGSDQYRPQSLAEWAGALSRILSWPWLPWAPLLQVPVAALVVIRFRQGRLGTQEGVLLGLALWTWAQFAAQAYSRGHSGLLSRYCDLCSVGVAVNALAAGRLARWRPRVWAPLAVGWALLLAAGLRSESVKASADLASHSGEALAQQRLLSDFARTGDPGALRATPPGRLPYPSAERLVEIMTLPGLHAMLPPGIRSPVRLRPDTGSEGFLLTEAPVPGGGGGEVAAYVWRSSADGSRFQGTPLPDSSLPWLRFQVAGPLLLSEGSTGARPLTLDATPRSGWKTIFLPNVPGARISAAQQGGGTAAFTCPEEVGRWSMLGYRVRSMGGIIAALGLGAACAAVPAILAPFLMRLRRPTRESGTRIGA